ncbi:hypothetical protein [Myroides sp. WP-1]|uniref:hypothetical protein n=1 Tax=Myroides sp. WP-1 TaxID=2759944 RepID=UPI0015FB1259|nr:hypothetical protein [Myroides sp. WP-1]MBB1140748.1 hypothetical protein [Myroides sp. WP-1]
MRKWLTLVACACPLLFFGQTEMPQGEQTIALSQLGVSLDNITPKEYEDHIVQTWNIDRNKIVYVTTEMSLFRLASSLHGSMLSFAEGQKSTSAEILDGRKMNDKKACGIALNNLDLDNVKKHLKKGKNYQKLKLKRLTDHSDYQLGEELTSVLIYSKKLDYFIGDYFKIVTEYNKQNVDYVLIVFDDEITSQIPGALNNGGVR